MKRSTRRALSMFVMSAAVTGVVVGAVAWLSRRQNGTPQPPSSMPASHPKPPPVAILQEANRPATQLTSLPATEPEEVLSPAEALTCYEHGLELLKQADLRDRQLVVDLLKLQARGELSKAVFSGRLPGPQQAQAIAHLDKLFDQTILSRGAIEGDPYAMPYIVRPGDIMEGKNGIEQRLDLHVPARLLLRINGLSRGEDLRPGPAIKLIRGPFHAIVNKGDFTMDLYLHRPGLERVFCKRVKVGLGMNGSTPVGLWHVQQGQKMERPPWDPPPGTGTRRRILWGEVGYAFGVKGLWIGLEGLEERTAGITDFGIHSTNDPNSIGRANSLGCVRMSDEDIDLVFSLLYDVHSTVLVGP